ncbi:hypothetical protein ACYOEI_06855 [Singulisphaera rosea]
MIFKNQNGYHTFAEFHCDTVIVEAAMTKIQEGVIAIDQHYANVDPEQHAKLLAMASTLMTMLEDE